MVGLGVIVGERDGGFELVGDNVGFIVGCIPGKHSIFSSALAAASQHPAMPHLKVLSIIAVVLTSAVLVCVVCHHALREGTVRVVVERKVVRRNTFQYKSIDAQIVHLLHTFLRLSVLLGTFAKIIGTIGGTAPTIILEEARSCFA